MKQTKIPFSQAKAVNRKADNVTGMEQPVSIALSRQNFSLFFLEIEKITFTFLPEEKILAVTFIPGYEARRVPLPRGWRSEPWPSQEGEKSSPLQPGLTSESTTP